MGKPITQRNFILLLSLAAGAVAVHAGPCTGAYTLDTGIPGGSCTQGVAQFGSLNYTMQDNGPTADQISAAFSGTGLGPQAATFSSPYWIAGQPSDSFSDFITEEITAAPGDVITSITLDLYNFDIGSNVWNDYIEVSTQFCTNSSVTCALSDPNYGGVVSITGGGTPASDYCYNGNPSTPCNPFGQSGPATINFDPSLGITSIYVSNFLVLTDNDDTLMSLGSFDNQVTEMDAPAAGAPEPATFGLLGIALALLALRKFFAK